MAKKNWHRLTFDERAALQKERNARFAPRLFRCKHCRVTVDERSREGHVGRCPEIAKQGATFARFAPIDDHFDEVKL